MRWAAKYNSPNQSVINTLPVVKGHATMSSTNPATTFLVNDVVSAACAVYRTNGYVKKSHADGEKIQANSSLIYSHFFSPETFTADIQEQDRSSAEEIVDYLRGLSFKTMERGLTDFESNVLKFVTAERVDKSSIGIAASLPQVYQHKLDQDKWEQRESELAGTSDFVGEYKKRGDFEVVVENVRYIGRTESYLYCTSVDGKNILKFFSPEKCAEVGQTVALSGYVKLHSVSKYHGGKETMINRIRVQSAE